MDIHSRNSASSVKSQNVESDINGSDFDIEEIPFQSGDIVNGHSDYQNDYGYIVCYEEDYRRKRAYLMQYLDRYPEMYDLDGYFESEMVFDSILNPRIPNEKDLNYRDMIYGWISMTGLIYQTPPQLSAMKFSPKHGRIINVQSLCE